MILLCIGNDSLIHDNWYLFNFITILFFKNKRYSKLLIISISIQHLIFQDCIKSLKKLFVARKNDEYVHYMKCDPCDGHMETQFYLAQTSHNQS